MPKTTISRNSEFLVQYTHMYPVINASAAKTIRSNVQKITREQSLDHITFDTTVRGFSLGRNLHTLFTNPVGSPTDIKLREDLAAYGVTYDVVLNNTLRERSTDTGGNDLFYPISNFQEVSIQETRPSRVKPKNEKTKTTQPAKTKEPKTSNAPAKQKPLKATNAPRVGRPRLKAKAKIVESQQPQIISTIEQAREKYREWIKLIGVRGVSDIIEWANPKEGAEDCDPDQTLQFGKFTVPSIEVKNTADILIAAGELEVRGIHGYIPQGKLEEVNRQVITDRRNL